MKNLKVIFLLIITIGLNAQQVNPNEVLDKVKEKLNLVNDYQVNATVKVNVNFLKVPDSKVTLYFKKPDKIKMESDGFALLPRQSFNFSPAILLKDDYTAVYAKEDTVDGNDVHLIKILPLSDSSDIILSNLWIDKEENIVRKIETSTKKAGTVTIALKYDEQVKYALPSELKVSFKVEGMDLPAEMKAEQEAKQNSRRNEPLSGTVTISYSNYIVNKGIDDSLFEEKK